MSKLTDKQTAAVAGVLILVAYGVLIAEFTDSRTVILISDVISGLAVIGIALLLYPYFRPYFKWASIFYLLTKLVEGLLMIYGGFTQMSESLEHHKEFIYETPHMVMFIAGALALYYLLYQTKLVPRFISIWGFIAIGFLLIKSTAGWVGLDLSVLDPLLILIITNEIVLAGWFIWKGFDLDWSKKLKSASAQ